MVRLVSFVDPDGMEAEIALWADGPMRSMSERTMTPFEG